MSNQNNQENINNYQQQNQKSISSFFDNAFLSDIQIIESTNGKTYNMHKLALASKSMYFYEQLLQNPDLKQFTLPKFVQSSFQQNEFSGEIIDSVLKNFYSVYATPLEGFVKGGLERHNCFIFLSVAKSLGMREAQFVIQNFITQHLKYDSNNSFGMLKDGIKMENEEIIKMARQLISDNFSYIMNKKNLNTQLNQIPYEEFLNLISQNELKAQTENEVLQSVQNYIEYTNNLPENPDHPIEKNKDTQELKEKTDENEKLPPEEVNPKEVEKSKIDDKQAENQENTDLEILANDKLKQYKLTENQKQNLLEQVRLHYVTNDQLLLASQNQIFGTFKDQFLKSISNKLQELENPGQQLLVQPRDSYKQQVQNAHQQLLESKQNFNNNRNQLNNYNNSNRKFNSINQNNNNNNNNNNQIMNLGFDSKTIDHGYDNNNLNYKKNQKNIGNQESLFKQNEQIGDRSNFYTNLQDQGNIYFYDQNNAQHLQKIKQGQDNFNQTQIQLQERDPNNPNYSWVQHHQEVPYFNSQLQNNNSNYNQSNLAGSKHQLEFKYDRDYDMNGVFYYLGTLGKTQQFKSPHSLGQCKVFFSSIRTGRVEDFVGRSVTNLSTNNEKHSFMAVDLGKDRYLFPSSYTIRNRNSTTHICFNWCLEGSNNGKDWYVLDKRINFSESNPRFNQMMDNERQMLMQRGATTTWGIDTTALKKFFEKNYQIERGFRMFKITQLFENSHSTDNLCLSGLELYGIANGSRWKTFD